MTFTGFGDATFRFMRDLGRNNDKTWFQAHRSAYEDDLLEPSMAFIEAIGPLLARFSKDKRPYKDHLDLTFKVGPAKTSPGYWFRLTPNELILGAGMHMLDKPDLERYRTAVDANPSGAELAKVVTKVERAGYDV